MLQADGPPQAHPITVGRRIHAERQRCAHREVSEGVAPGRLSRQPDLFTFRTGQQPDVFAAAADPAGRGRLEGVARPGPEQALAVIGAQQARGGVARQRESRAVGQGVERHVRGGAEFDGVECRRSGQCDVDRLGYGVQRPDPQAVVGVGVGPGPHLPAKQVAAGTGADRGPGVRFGCAPLQGVAVGAPGPGADHQRTAGVARLAQFAQRQNALAPGADGTALTGRQRVTEAGVRAGVANLDGITAVRCTAAGSDAVHDQPVVPGRQRATDQEIPVVRPVIAVGDDPSLRIVEPCFDVDRRVGRHLHQPILRQ